MRCCCFDGVLMTVHAKKVYKVLVVDDEELVVEVLRELLTGLPYTIVTTTDPSKALQILKMWEIAVLVCDLNMPEIDGIQVLSKAHEVNPDTVSILISGVADQDSTVKAINEGGVWKVVTKPWNSQNILHLVDEGVQRYMKLQGSPARLERLAHNVTEHFQHAEDVHPGRAQRRPIVVFKRDRKQSTGSEKTADIGTSRYRLGDVLGTGGTGTVYKAEDLLMGMPVAIKVLSSLLAEDQVAIGLLKEEARIAMQLSHRHIVRLHNLEKVGGKYFIVMEFVEGRSLREVLELYGKLPLETVMQIAEVAADALSYAHRHGVIHKDLKPDNMLLTEDGVLKIIDFGIASLKHAQNKDTPVMGTPLYMSPEQIMGKHLNERTDVYSLGIILSELLIGRPPFDKPVENTQQRMAQKPHLVGMADHLMKVLHKAIADDEADRWETVEEFVINFTDASSTVVYGR